MKQSAFWLMPAYTCAMWAPSAKATWSRNWFGGDTQRRSYRILKPGGIQVSVVSTFPEKATQPADIRTTFFLAEVNMHRLNTLSAMFDSGRISPRVGTVLLLEQPRIAHEMLAGAPHQKGKLILQIASQHR
jgi:NADPH:quinone reductase-like Zn-dependent oxidoreductase